MQINKSQKATTLVETYIVQINLCHLIYRKSSRDCSAIVAFYGTIIPSLYMQSLNIKNEISHSQCMDKNDDIEYILIILFAIYLVPL